MSNLEKRICGLEIRTVGNEHGEKIIEGHAAVFGQVANIGNQFYEVIERGAFDSADLADVFLHVNHERQDVPLARTTSGTLSLSIDDVGLAIRARLDVENNPAAKVLYSAITRGDICGMSFCFSVADDEWQNMNCDMPTRRVKKIGKVFEVSACATPAYVGTDLHAEAERALRSARNKKAEQLEIERLRASILEKSAEPSIVTRQSKKELSQMFNYEEAGTTLKDNNAKSVTSAYTASGELRISTVYPAAGQPATIAMPSYSGTTVNPDIRCVSSLVDAVSHLSLHGGESYLHPFVSDIGYGEYADELQNASETDMTFGSAEINRAKITAYAEISEEFDKLPSAAYAETVFENVRIAMRKFLAKEILFGVGESSGKHKINGIFSDRVPIDASTDINISDIRDNTLEEIIFSYGGGDDCAQPATLIMHKKDLQCFSAVRTSTRQAFYDVRFVTSDTGTINGVPFILSADVKPLMSNDTPSGEFCMAFGNPRNYLLTEFSPLEVRRSDDYKFRQGMVCFRGSAHVGGNVIARNAFVRIKKA